MLTHDVFLAACLFCGLRACYKALSYIWKTLFRKTEIKMATTWQDMLSKIEFQPEREVVRVAIPALLKRFPLARVEVEYPVSTRYPQCGTGDVRLVTDDTVILLEAKFLDVQASGHNACTKRTKHRQKVVEQCILYSAWARIQFRDKTILGFVATNEDPLPRQVVFGMSHEDATDRVVAFLRSLGQTHVWGGLINSLVRHKRG